MLFYVRHFTMHQALEGLQEPLCGMASPIQLLPIAEYWTCERHTGSSEPIRSSTELTITSRKNLLFFDPYM